MDIYYIGIHGTLFNKGDIGKDAPDVDYVTHANYRALEERYEALKVTEREGYAEYHRTRVELSSIKARVVELVAADHEYDICSLEFREAYNEGCDETEALADDLTRAASRRRLALESFT